MTSEKINLVEAQSGGEVSLEQVAIRLHPQDQVAIVKENLQKGTILVLKEEEATGPQLVAVQGFISSGHKVALEAIDTGQAVRRYGQIIGFATQPIRPGEHIHTHNLGLGEFARDYAFSAEVQPVTYVPAHERQSFKGYRRAVGQVGTRNYMAVIGTVNCSAHACREIAHHFTPERLAAYPNVDGVIALTHSLGCCAPAEGSNYVLLQRTLAGMASHPNVGGYLLVGLGCEANQVEEMVKNYGLDGTKQATHLIIQEVGGLRKTIEAGISAVERMLPQINEIQRTSEPISELKLALECGGSDSWSGVTANPVVGLVADRLVRQGGTVILAETPEIYGAEHLLTRRAINEAVGRKLVDKVHWWERYVERHGLEINNNPSPGNKAGGLTNIYEKSLGAIAKGGSTPLTGVYDYAEPVTGRGFTFMDTTGYDPVSVTGMVAGGCNLVLFTTGRGSVFGFKPAPSIKICTNSITYRRMPEDMDLNAGQVVEGVPMDQVADELLALVIEVASGRPSKSEAQGVGEAEFIPWSVSSPV